MKNKLFYILLLICTIGFSQNSIVKSEIDTTNIRIGEQFQYKISVQETENVIIPKLEKLNGLEVISEGKIDTIKNNLIKKYILTGFDSGAFYIPQQQIFIKNQAYVTDSLLINVATIAVDTTKVKKFPIKGIKGEPLQLEDFRQYLWYAILLLTLIAFLIYYFVFKKKKETAEIVAIPTLAPYEEALEKLHQLDKKLLWQNNKIKKYYSELTDILRNYIGRDIEIPTLELTSNEIIDLISVQNETKKLGLTDEIINDIRKILRNADLVKFAKSKPMSNEIEFDRKTTEQLISTIQPKIKEYKTALLAENPNLIEENKVFDQQNIDKENKITSIKKRKKFNKKYLIIPLVLVGITVFSVIGYSFGKKIYNAVAKYVDTTTTQKLFTGNWKTKSIGYPAISIETPVELKKESIAIPAEVKEMVSAMETYGYTSIVNGLQIVVMYNQYVEGIEANLDGAVNGAIAQIQQQPSVSNFKHTVESYSLENIEGSKLLGTYTENAISKEFEIFVFVNKNNMWMLLTSHKEGDVFGEKITTRVANSIKINIEDELD